ncbi:MAG: AraC family transcriptional regulator [Cyanobacteria bacterium P01_F01_bin.150]
MNAQRESAWLWKPRLPGLELFEAQLFSHRFSKHFHETYTIGFNEQGQGTSFCQGEHQGLYPGRFNLINPGEVHTGEALCQDSGWSFRNIYIDVATVQHIMEQCEWPNALPYFKSVSAVDASLQTKFYRLFKVLVNDGAGAMSVLAQQSLLLDVLSHLFGRYGEASIPLRSPGAESQAVTTVRQYLEIHYGDRITLNELATLVNLNPHYLIRCFRQQVGCPPHQYQQQWQLLKAKQALQTNQRIAEIATDHGFYDQSHLTRVFKRTFGVTPGHYQKVNSVQYC